MSTIIQTKTKRTRSAPEVTRQRLVDAALEVIRAEGIAAASTVTITRAAGMAQSSFYMHFPNVEACLTEAAEQTAQQIRTFIAEDRRRMQTESSDDHAAHAAHYLAVLNLFQQERPLGEVLLKGRYDRSPVGVVMQRLVEQIREDLLADLWQIGKSLGIADVHYDRAALLATFIQAKVLAAGEALIEGRIADPQLVADELAATVGAESVDLVKRCLSSN